MARKIQLAVDIGRRSAVAQTERGAHGATDGHDEVILGHACVQPHANAQRPSRRGDGRLDVQHS